MTADRIDVIAANPGFELLEYFHNEGGADACVARSPIVGWRVTNGDYAEPIAADGPVTNTGAAVVKYPDGRVTLPACQTWDNEALWLADVSALQAEQRKRA